MSSFITRFLANMTTKESKPAPAPAPEARPRRHERSSRHQDNHHHHHRHSSRHDYHRSSYVYDSDETETETDDEPLSENSLMLDLGPDYSPKAMSSISFPSPPHQSIILFETDDVDLGADPVHIEQHQPPTATNAKPKRKPVQYYDAPAAHAEVNFRQQRGRSSSRSSTASQDYDRRTPGADRPRGR